MNPDEHEDPTPTYTGEVYITVCVQIQDMEADSEAEVSSQALSALKECLNNHQSVFANYESEVYVQEIEDWDLYQSNAPKGFLELADDAYDRAKDN